MPFDVENLPETATITQHFSPTFVWSRPGESGTYTLKRSPVGFETGAGLAGLVTAAVFSLQGGGFDGGGRSSRSFEELAEEATPVVEVEEEPAPPADLEQQADTRASLQQVKLGLVIYKSDKGSFPENLEELLAPTPTYPKGFLNTDSLPGDGWGNALHYAVEEGSGGYRLWSGGPDGANNGGEGDDVPAP